MFTGVYTGYGLHVRTENGVITDDRINLHSSLLISDPDMNSYKRWLAKEDLAAVNCGHGYAKKFMRLIPMNADGTESLLLIHLPYDGDIGVREDNIVDMQEADEDKVTVQKLMNTPFGFPTKRYIQTADGKFHHIEEHVWQNILIRYYNSGVEGNQEINTFANRFGFVDGQHMIDSVRLSIVPEIFYFLDWANLFKNELTIAKLEPMMVTVKKISEPFTAFA